MLKIMAKQVEPRGWGVKATLSGRGISSTASGWVYGTTKKRALRKLETVLSNEYRISRAALYRIEACSVMARMAVLEEEKL